MLLRCYAEGGTGALHKIVMSRENYVDILKQHLKTLVRKLKLVRKWVFQMDNDPNILPKLFLRTTKPRYWSAQHKP